VISKQSEQANISLLNAEFARLESDVDSLGVWLKAQYPIESNHSRILMGKLDILINRIKIINSLKRS
jgi:hypothetical protein